NTRLQVEHPVTEMITGIDLVEWQLRIAAGEPLPRQQDAISVDGHAFEARLYAEDAAKGFLPAVGTLHHLQFPESSASGTTLRVETGVRAGDTISPFYDPMIAKLVVHGADRASALEGLKEALRATEIAGSVTNIAFLDALASDPDFADGDVDTGLIGRKQDRLTTAATPTANTIADALIAASEIGTGIASDDPWSTLGSYAHFHACGRAVRILSGEDTYEGRVLRGADGSISVSGESFSPVKRGQDNHMRFARWPDHVTVFENGRAFTFNVPDPLAVAEDSAAGSMRAPMPGLVKLVRALAGDKVTKGQPLLVLEAMKMEHTIAAPHDGTIAEIASEGSQVSEGAVLARFSEET
ncbi:MAG: 3-methylcrotonyl-CoA carboxylase, partial [Rhizobiaceae bacterium]|nr:3-methylcrotonyl-CoA carboxylase [Rhizobiaceae bacterium]